MENTSPFLAMQKTEAHIKALLRSMDTDLMEPAEKKVVATLRRLSVDARLDIRDYELSETRDEQLKCAAKAKRRLLQLEKALLSTGQIFGAADIAQLSAQLAQISAWLR